MAPPSDEVFEGSSGCVLTPRSLNIDEGEENQDGDLGVPEAAGPLADPDEKRVPEAKVNNAEGREEFTADEIMVCLRILQRLGEDRALLELHQMRPVRKALMALLDDARERLPNKSAQDKETKKKHEKQMKRQRQQLRAEWDKRWVDNAEMRRARFGALEQLQSQLPEAMPLVPDGAASTRVAPVQHMRALPPTDVAVDGCGGREAAGHETVGHETARHETTTHEAAGYEAHGAMADGPDEKCQEADAPELVQPRACYTCHRRFTTLHHFYDRLCPPCAELNWQKRHQIVTLSADFVAFVSGGRVKIGFEVAKKLLVCGATVIVTSRFPRDCCSRFAALPGFEDFAGRLHVYGVDFRSLDSVQKLCSDLASRCPHLDAVVHNACQTVRRPARYYKDVAFGELEDGPAPRCLAIRDASVAAASPGDMPTPEVVGFAGGETVLSSAPGLLGALAPSAAMSQLRVLEEDGEAFEAEMPRGATDVNGQQLDLRKKHSWKLRLHEVSTEELVECLCVNTITPFTLNAKLKELLLRSPRAERFIVNVSAMEGKFYRTKTVNHPHTNMAKAALNMMTRTSAQDYAVEGIFMNSVDTGWINDENPLPTAHRIASEHNFQSPLDEVDAAARILDPVLSPLISGERPVWGKFLKDYAETEW
mmetsp:Transcript_79899/g.222548  ORF Transcript_79899/g.222548 Transcript_79899/m.222548 type:complete len:651 (-) Transcript_79899:126-2078(-)